MDLQFNHYGEIIYVRIRVPKKLPDASVEDNPTSYQSYDENGGLIRHIGHHPTLNTDCDKNKQRHYWIWSRSANVGKSLNINTVCMYCFAAYPLL